MKKVFLEGYTSQNCGQRHELGTRNMQFADGVNHSLNRLPNLGESFLIWLIPFYDHLLYYCIFISDFLETDKRWFKSVYVVFKVFIYSSRFFLSQFFIRLNLEINTKFI